MAGEPSRGTNEVVAINERQLRKQSDRPFLSDHSPQPIQQKSTEIRPDSGGDENEHDVHVTSLDEESRERKDHLAGDGREHRLNQNDETDSDFTKRIDQAGRHTDESVELLD